MTPSIIVRLLTLILFLAMGAGQSESELAKLSIAVPRVDVPYADPADPGDLPPQRAVFWFGAVDPTGNYADGRVFFDDEKVTISFHVIDRQLYYDVTASGEPLTDWDAVTLYLDMETAGTSPPDETAYRLVAQLNHAQPRAPYQAAYQGSGGGWSPAALDFTTKTSWRGTGLNGPAGDHGWHVVYQVPFANLGLAERPADGTLWRIAAVVHDRDDVAGTAIPDRVWPPQMAADDSRSWAELRFGLPGYDPPPIENPQEIVIRQGLNGVSVVDAHVGGHSTCGDGLDFFAEWGDANYVGMAQVNVQNQWDIADWPCFSKYYITFPLDDIPAGNTIAQATLRMVQFGNAGMGQGPQPSLIQVLTITEDWDEESITWNTAPLAQTYAAATWVDPISEEPGAADVAHEWDIGRAAAEAYAAGQPLRLVVYSADTAQHSGRYFWGSDVGDWNEEARPTLHLVWGQRIDLTERVHLPFLVN